MRLSDYGTFSLYLALKNHFNQKTYDFFKYNGKSSVSKESFAIRKDKFQFQKLSKRYDETEMRDFLVANFLYDSNIWVGQLLEEEAKDRYYEYVKRKESLTYIFGDELEYALRTVDNPKDLFACKGKTWPAICDLYMQNAVSDHTFALLDHFIGFIDKCDGKVNDDFIWPKVRMKCKKFFPFIEFDRKKLSSILKERLESHIYTIDADK